MDMTDREAQWLEVIEYIKTWVWSQYIRRYRVSANFDIVLAKGKTARSSRAWKDAKGNSITYGQPYRIAKQKSGTVIYIDRSLFESQDADLGDRSNGVVCVVIRALCEYVARELSREWKSDKALPEAFPVNEKQLRRANAAIVKERSNGKRFSSFYYPPEEAQALRPKRKAKTKEKKLRMRGWFSYWTSIVREICGSCPPQVQMVTTEPREGNYKVSKNTLHVRRKTLTGKKAYIGGVRHIRVDLRTGPVLIPQKEDYADAS